MNEISVEEMLHKFGRRLGLELVAGEEGLSRLVLQADTHRPGLALAGFVEVFNYDMIQVLGNHEIEYLRSLPKQRRSESLHIIYQFNMPCVIVTGRGRLLPELRDFANRCDIPLLRSQFDTTQFSHLLHFYLDGVFAPKVTLHGTLLDVNGIGLLFTGRSGIGKSEVGLDLVERGHRLVADDTVIVTRQTQGMLIGNSPEVLQDHMEIRGIGIVNIKKMFGVRGARRQKRVEVMVNLVDWDEKYEYERVGLDDKVKIILGVEIPEITVPLVPGKNITVIAETIALNHLLRIDGDHPAREFNSRLLCNIGQKQNKPVGS